MYIVFAYVYEREEVEWLLDKKVSERAKQQQQWQITTNGDLVQILSTTKRLKLSGTQHEHLNELKQH